MNAAPHDLPFLSILRHLQTAVWVYDVKGRMIVWGNAKALEVWDCATLDALRALDFSGISESNITTIDTLVTQFECELRTQAPPEYRTDVWTTFPTVTALFPLEEWNSAKTLSDFLKRKPTTVKCTLTGLLLNSSERWMLLNEGNASPLPPPTNDIKSQQVYLLAQTAPPSDDFVPKELRNQESFKNTTGNISLFSSTLECLMENPAAVKTYNNVPLCERFVEPHIVQHIKKVFDPQSLPYQCNTQMVTTHPEERVRWFSVDARRIQDPVTGDNVVLLHTTDVHELHKSQYKLSRVEEVAKIGTWEYDPQTQLFSCSPQFFKHFGCDPNRDKIAISELLELIHPADRTHFTAAHDNYLKGNLESSELVVHVVPEDQPSSMRTLLTHTECITDAAGTVMKLVGSCQDVTLLTSYAENLQTAEEFVKAVVSHVQAGLMAINTQGQLTLINRNARAIHGIDDDEHIPDLVSLANDLRDFDDNPIKLEDTPLLRALAGESVKDVLLKVIPPGKSTEDAMVLSCSGQLLLKPDGTKLGAVLAIQNVTEHKQAEKALREAKEEAELASKLKSEFMARLSHEIRTPFNGILGMISLALETDMPPLAKEHLESALECTHFLLNIINTLLDFSKLETKHVELCPVPFLLRSSVGTILSLFETQAREKKIVLELEVEAQVPDSLYGDVDRLRQIVTHLVDNSIKFSKPPGGRVAVCIDLTPEQPLNNNIVELLFKVADNGIGIPEEKQKLLFGSFYQVDGSSTRQQGGVGLGLAICENLVLLFGGKIWCTSVEGQGSTFYFSVQVERPSKYDKYSARHRRAVSTSVIENTNSPPQTYSPPLTHSSSSPASSPTSISGPAYSPRATSPVFSPSFSALRSSAPPSLKHRVPSSPKLIDMPLLSPRRHGLLPPPTPTVTTPSSPLFPLPTFLPAFSNPSFHQPHGDKRDLRRFSYAGPPTNYSSPKISSPNISSRQLRILLCEDNTINQKVVVRMLAKYGHNITIANDGREAVSIFENTDPKNRFECILMDIQMPHMNGCEASHRIRLIEKEKGWPYVPIIAVSAYVEEKDKFAAAGIDAYIAKPINQPALLETMYQLTLRYNTGDNEGVDLDGKPDDTSCTTTNSSTDTFRTTDNSNNN